MKVRIEIDTKTFVRFWLVMLGFVLGAYLLYSARTALIILGTALFLALALNGPVSRVAKHLPGNSRVMSTALSYVVVVAFLGAFIFLAVPPIVQQTVKFAQTVPGLIETAQSQSAGLNGFITQYNLQPQVDRAVQSINENTSQWASSVGGNVISGIGSFFALMAAMVLTLVLSFLMLIEGPSWMQSIWALYKNKSRMKRHRHVVQRMHGVVSGYVTGQLTISALGATFAGIVVFILSMTFPGVPANLAVPAAAITFILSLIPLFGATIGGLIVGALLAFNSAGAAIVYLVYFVVYQQIENNYIAPTIQSKRNDLTPLAILGSVTVGLYLFGIAGGIVSIPIAGAIRILFETYIEDGDAAAIKKDKTEKLDTKKLIAKS